MGMKQEVAWLLEVAFAEGVADGCHTCGASATRVRIQFQCGRGTARPPSMREPRTIIHYTKAIKHSLKGAWSSSLLLFAEVQTQGLRLDRILITETCKMLGRFGAWRSSHNLLGCKVQLDMITYTTAINACETANWQDALVTRTPTFAQGGAPVDATAQNIQLSACEKGQEWCQAMDRFQLAAWRGLSSNAICYHATMSACGAREKWQHVLQLFDAFGAQQLQTNIVTYGALLSGLESAAQGSAGSGVRWRQTQEVLCDLYQNQLEINLICTNAAMMYVETSRISQSSVLSSSMDWALAMRLFLGSETRRFLPSILDFQALLGACSTGGACGVLVRFLPCLRELSFQWQRHLEPDGNSVASYKRFNPTCLRVLAGFAMGKRSPSPQALSPLPRKTKKAIKKSKAEKELSEPILERPKEEVMLKSRERAEKEQARKRAAEAAKEVMKVKTKENKEKRKTKVKEKPELEPVAEEHIACVAHEHLGTH
eukprot:g25510.t1